MTEFDSKKFSAVTEFFHEPTASSETQSNAKVIQSYGDHGGAKRSGRLGLGAENIKRSDQEATTLEANEDVKKIFTIGRRRKQGHLADDASVENYGVGNDAEVDSHDEDEGRTSAIKDRTKLKRKDRSSFDDQVESSMAHTIKSKKKKKMGKKERLAMKQMSTETSIDSGYHEAGSKIDNDSIENKTQIKDQGEDINSNKNTKRKRRKVRSRQKNIRKDTRNSSQKPEHLRLRGGLVEYRGRPLTKETRDKLNIPESRTSFKKKDVTVQSENDRDDYVDKCDVAQDDDGNSSTLADSISDSNPKSVGVVDSGEIVNDTDAIDSGEIVNDTNLGSKETEGDGVNANLIVGNSISTTNAFDKLKKKKKMRKQKKSKEKISKYKNLR